MQNFGGKSERKRRVGISMYSWEDVIKIDLKEIRCEYVN
jgi:hypothetical protein